MNQAFLIPQFQSHKLKSVVALFISLSVTSMKFLIPSCCYCARTADDLCPSASTVADIFTEQGQDEINKDSIRRFNSTEIDYAIMRSSNVIAEGGFSTVYRARLPGSSSPLAAAAFKVHDQSSERLYRMFCQEREVLLRVSHPNIVRLLGYSDDGKAAGVLVFEHVPNGTVHDVLHASSKFVLSWPQRMYIAFRLALALDYLHEGCDIQIIHGDIKASNVLLDSNLSPKLCDFGFARMGFSAAVARSASPMMGSPGYVDPYYLRTGLVSKKSDVYSFGVLILELITGMEAFSEEKSRMLTTVMRPRLQEASKAREVLDHRIMSGEYDEAEVAAMAKIAAQCIGGNPSLRPSMGEVLKIMRESVPSAIAAADARDIERQEK